VQQYDVNTGALIDLVREDEVGGSMGLVGPFVYSLSTVNADRLEPLFRIAPLQRTLPPPPDAHTMDVLVVRPSLDISLEGKCDEKTRERFKERVWTVLNAAYQDGAHIKAQYDSPDGKTKGPPVVEYFRVGGWQWVPEEDDEKAHLLCVDGKIFHTPKGGNVLARTARRLDISVYA